MSATKTKIQSIIDENPVAVFSKSYCPYCRATKQLLSENGAKFYAIELDQVGMFRALVYLGASSVALRQSQWLRAPG
jgi:thiol-disulfide isomerase/thioredoxin